MNIEVISIDCGDTLIYRTKEDYLAVFEALTELSYNLNIEKVRDSLERARLWWRNEKARTGRIWDEEARITMIGRMLSILGLPYSTDLALRLGDLWLEKADYKAYDDAEPLLKILRNLGYRLIVISNSSSKRNLEANLRRTGLLGYFELLISSGSVGYEKPDPEIFKIASRLCEIPLDRMLHIGNDYEDDYLGALRTGMKAILLDRDDRCMDKNCVRVRKLTEIPVILKRLG
jgi:putative hydrolase of the HAD superfamily